ncbi:MAG TPA: YkgJ family cysteine cluster protein [Methanoregulaceae archaeon]|nr:YkgJ family cysteine cluster protein [Methanoregulaceae archaeon]
MTDSRTAGPGKFACTRCGACCVSLGNTIRIERKAGPRAYYCRDVISGNLSLVHIEAPCVPFFQEARGREQGKGCAFLVRMPEEYACAVYQTRPLLCREFQCCRMRIYRPDGQVAGTVKGRRSLSSDDPGLRELWNAEIAALSTEHDGTWDLQVKKILQNAGFTVDLYR